MFQQYPKPENPDDVWEKYSKYTPDNVHEGASMVGDQIRICSENLVFYILLRNVHIHGDVLRGNRTDPHLIDRKMYWTVYNDLVTIVLGKYGNWEKQENLEANLPI